MLNPVLPQDDKLAPTRTAEFVLRRSQYQYDYDQFPGLAMAASVPLVEQPTPQWRQMIAEKLVELLTNSAKVEKRMEVADERTLQERWAHVTQVPMDQARRLFGGELKMPDPSSEMKKLAAVVERVHAKGIQGVFGDLVQKAALGDIKGRPKSPADFDLLFQGLPCPPLAGSYTDDAAFAMLRVAGPSPRILRRMTAPDSRFPVTDAHYRITMGEGDSLDAAMKEGRVYLCDYAVLDGATAGTFPGPQKYLSAPLAMFAVPRGRGALRAMRPIAIQCHQKPGPDAPIFTPADGHAWMMARGFVMVADGIVHQAITHLARTHLVMEAFKIATERQLSLRHPIGVLLRPHFEGTLNINDGAQGYLTAPTGGVDYLLAGTIEFSRTGVVAGLQSFDFTAEMLPRDLATRGVDDAEALPLYPYRDDAKLLWDAIGAWVGEYVGIYYKDDAAVVADTEIQAWIAEAGAKDGGRIKGVPGSLPDRAALIEAVTMVVFTASAQHAAVNSPQNEVMSYAPTFPLASYAPPPTSVEGVTAEHCLAQMPTLDAALLQLDLGYMLGSLCYTRLGRYQNALGIPQFLDPRVKEPLERFHASLERIEQEIGARNVIRPSYDFLRPSRIPQSINI